MNGLTKIRDLSLKYDISARALKYYEDMGLLQSTKGVDYAYRMYDEMAVKRLEQILILRKLNISIKDIQRIFNTSGSHIVLEVLEKKVENIDEEVALLHELKEVVLGFIHQIEKADFTSDSDVKLLYAKAREIEGQLTNVDYNGNPTNINRLIDVTDKLKKAPEVRIIELPKCRMATSGHGTFEVVGKFDKWWPEYEKKRKGITFMPFDFMWFEDGKTVWWMAVENDATKEDVGGYDIIDYEGGIYAAAMSIDGDDDICGRVYNGIKAWVENSGGFELDERTGHQTMCHMVNPTERIKKGLGYHQLDIYVPVKLKDPSPQ